MAKIKDKISKKILDSITSFIGIIILSPLFLLVGILVRMTSRESMFFKQERVGVNGELFKIVKFRTMKTVKNPIFPPSNEQSITKMGQILRKTKLDELPNLFNVLTGKMSFVGPRPELPKFVHNFQSEFDEIFSQVKPGIVDFASILLHDEENILRNVGNPLEYYENTILPKKITLIKKYIQQQKFWLDICLMFLLFFVVISPKNAQLITQKLIGKSDI